MADIVLETIGLTKSYGSLKAVNNFTIKLDSNKIYGLLGRNGAGKTTLLDLITSRIFADSGDIKIFGQNAVENQELLPKLCYMPEKNLFITTMRVSDILQAASGFYDNFDIDYANRLCKKFALDTKKKYRALSRGYESILRIVIGLASRAPVTIFDEPVLGLDAAVRDLFYRELLEDYSNNPRTFIVSTHLIEESADVFEDILIIKDGALVEHLPVDELKEKARYISGKAAAVDEVVTGLKVIYSEIVGSVKICAVYGGLTEDLLKKCAGCEVDISPVPVQKLFIYLTNSELI
jgi:ABC-2 type transport system ATP-binding protein